MSARQGGDAHDFLVIGADSYIGAALMMELRVRGYRGLGTTRRAPLEFGLVSFDLCAPSALPKADVSYFCAGLGFRQCEEDPSLARQTNVLGPLLAARQIVEVGGKVVMLSSSAAETRLDSVYGMLKRDCEREFLAYDTRAAVFRFGPIWRVGRSPYADHDFQPLGLADIVHRLAGLLSQWTPGLHRVTVPSQGRARVA